MGERRGGQERAGEEGTSGQWVVITSGKPGLAFVSNTNIQLVMMRCLCLSSQVVGPALGSLQWVMVAQQVANGHTSQPVATGATGNHREPQEQVGGQGQSR